MQKHTKIYMQFFGYQIAEDVVCEITGEPANDIHHINGRGKGKDVIENLIAIVNRIHFPTHNGTPPYTKKEFEAIHQEFMRRNNRKIK